MILKPTPHIRRPAASDSTVHHRSAAPGHAPAPGRELHAISSESAVSSTMPASQRLHRKQAATYLGVSLSWLDKSRLRGDGPPFLRVGGRTLYDSLDLDAFLARCRRNSTSQGP